MTPANICDTLLTISKEAGRLALAIKGEGAISVLDWREFVTEADKRVDALISSLLTSHFPQIPIYSEEAENQQPITSGWVFVVDPIDGTNNYARDFGPWSISIAAVFDGLTRVGVVHDPVRNRTYYAHADMPGSFCDMAGEPVVLTVSNTTDLRTAHVWTDWVKGDNTEPLAVLALLKEHTTYPRIAMCSTQTLMRIAQGQLDGYIHTKPGPEDIAAAAYILAQAGGIVTTLTGELWSPFGGGIIAASNRKLHNQLLDLLSPPRAT
jgi:myo-inositol-1(or 4)-monophosphatase